MAATRLIQLRRLVICQSKVGEFAKAPNGLSGIMSILTTGSIAAGPPVLSCSTQNDRRKPAIKTNRNLLKKSCKGACKGALDIYH